MAVQSEDTGEEHVTLGATRADFYQVHVWTFTVPD